jgi:hypothetical protein
MNPRSLAFVLIAALAVLTPLGLLFAGLSEAGGDGGGEFLALLPVTAVLSVGLGAGGVYLMRGRSASLKWLAAAAAAALPWIFLGLILAAF